MRRLTFNPRNTAPQQLASVILDTSGSMDGDPLAEVQRGAIKFQADCAAEPILRERLQVQFVRFGGDVCCTPFAPIAEFEPPALHAGGGTPLAEAVLAAIETTDEQTELLRRVAELDIYKPLYFLLSDGQPGSSHDTMQLAAQRIRLYEQTRRGEFYGFGVDKVSVSALQPLFVRKVELLQGVNFKTFFDIISASVYHVSCRAIGEEADLHHVIRGFLEGPDHANKH